MFTAYREKIERRDFIWPLVALLLLALQVNSAFGQATSGALIGTVTDVSGAAVPRASVTIRSIERGTEYKTQTNESGNYTQTHLAAGAYTIEVEASGFVRFVQKEVAVSTDRATRVDAQLKVGAVTQEMTVTSAAPLLESDRAEVSTSLDSKQVQNLPVIDRNLTRLQLLLPGAQYHTFQHASSENPQAGLQINNNGLDFGTSNFLIDGTDNNNAVLGIINVNPTVDSVREFKHATGNFDAEFAQAGGAVIQVTTRSGTNQLHGSLFEHLQNDIFNARNPFSEPNGPPPLRWNQFGGSLGGPIRKNKIFLFGDYQGTRRRIGASLLTTTPTAAMRAGDFSALGVPIYDPTTGAPDGSGRTQFADEKRATAGNPQGLNIIPRDRISSASANLLALLPMPNFGAPGAFNNNYIATGSERFDSDQFNLRADHHFGEKLNYFLRYSFGDYRREDPPAFGPKAGGPGLSGLLFAGQSNARNQNAVGGATYVFGSKLTTDFRVGYTRYRVDVLPLDFGSTTAQDAGIPGVNLSGRPDTSGIPAFLIPGSGGFNFGYALAINQCNCPLNERYFEYQFVDNWTHLRGNHAFKWGADVRFAGNLRRPSDTRRNGVFNFNQQVTGEPNVAGSGLAAASFLLGLPTSFQRFIQQETNGEDRQWRMFYFAQDTWRVTNKLTLSYGLRWDTWFPDHTLNAGQGSRYDVRTNNLLIAGVGGVDKAANVETQWRNFSPRLGIAYQLDPKTVIRTGWGRSYFIEIFGFNFNNVANNFPTLATQNVSPSGLFTPVFSLTQGPPAPVFPQIPSSGLLPLPAGFGVNYLPADQKYPYVDSWNLSFERLLDASTTVTASYIGNVGRNRRPGVLGPRGIALNQAAPGPGALNPRRPLFNLFGLTQSINDLSTVMRSSYQALQTKLTKRLSEGSSLLVTYTWSKSMDYQFGMGTWFDLRLNHAVADFDRTHALTVGHVWQLPFGKGRRYLSNAGRLADYTLGGWQFSGITRYESGWPFSPTLSNTSSINADVPYLRPDVVAGADPYAVAGGQSRDRWFNVAAFQTPAAFKFGNAGRNSLRGPNFFTADWSLQKRFAVRENAGLSLRWDVFNIFNRTNLANPNTAVDAGANAAGRITGLIIGGTMRRMQAGLRFEF
jgi:hypothetical protein